MSIFAKRLYLTKREAEYKMQKISVGIAGLHQGKCYDIEKVLKNSIYGSVGNQRIQDMYPESIIKKEYLYKYEAQKKEAEK